MKWQDRQGSVNIQDRRVLQSGDPIADLINQTNATLDVLESMKGNGLQAPLPMRRHNFPADSWMQQSLDSAREFMYKDHPENSPPLPRPDMRRYR